MSADISIVTPPCTTCGHAPEGAEVNITYNLSKMLQKAGALPWRHLITLPAQVAGRHLLGVLDGMADNPAKWRAMNPANGWGTYDDCLQVRLRKFAEECVKSPDGSTLSGWL